LNSEGIGFRDRNWECGLYINESLGIYDLLNESRKNWDFQVLYATKVDSLRLLHNSTAMIM
jgi:hypothetical protein